MVYSSYLLCSLNTPCLRRGGVNFEGINSCQVPVSIYNNLFMLAESLERVNATRQRAERNDCMEHFYVRHD
jgi:hypothetical protein